jgi:hypothetical protein
LHLFEHEYTLLPQLISSPGGVLLSIMWGIKVGGKMVLSDAAVSPVRIEGAVKILSTGDDSFRVMFWCITLPLPVLFSELLLFVTDRTLRRFSWYNCLLITVLASLWSAASSRLNRKLSSIPKDTSPSSLRDVWLTKHNDRKTQAQSAQQASCGILRNLIPLPCDFFTVITR